MIKDKSKLLGSPEKRYLLKISAIKKLTQKLQFNIFQQQRADKPCREAPREVNIIAGGGNTLALSKETMIPASEEGTTATTRRSSKTQ